MAVQQWELESSDGRPVPKLRVVPAPPRGGRVVPALLFASLLIGVLAYPAIRAVGRPGPQVIYETPRGLPASQIAELDSLTGLSDVMRPVSSEPLGGILFVSCTNLWTALPDGSRARRLLAFSGISSPTFSPDARTIAIVGPGDDGPALFIVGADGSGLRLLGDLESDGMPIDARVSNLSWSPNGEKLAFALIDPAYDPWAEGATIWSLDLESGTFTRVGQGSPSPAFVERGIAYADRLSSNFEEKGSQLTGLSRAARHLGGRMSTITDDITFGVIPGVLSDSWSTKDGVVVLRESAAGRLELVTKANAWNRKIQNAYAAPSPYAFLRSGRVSVAQDGSHAVVDLVDPKGDRAMGIVDLDSGQWRVRDYAWSGVATPAPTYSGPVGAERAQRLAGDYFGSRHRSGGVTAASLLVGDELDDLLGGGRGGYILGSPDRSRTGWTVPATIYARSDGRYRFQHALFELSKTADGRLEGAARAVSLEQPLETIEDAQRFLSEVVGDELDFVWPTYLPPGVELDPRWPVDAYSYDGDVTATIHLRLPGRPERSMSIAYGDVGFGLGCGGEIDPQETQIGGAPALFDQTGEGPEHTKQVLWPGSLDQRDLGAYSVYGQLPRDEVERIAESMAAQG